MLPELCKELRRWIWYNRQEVLKSDCMLI